MSKSKYYVDGIPLSEYCKMHNLNPNTQRNRVKQYIDGHPELSEEEAIKLCFSKCGTTYSKYKYKGISLAKYCEENNLNYATMVDRVVSAKLKYGYSDDEATEYAVEEFTNYKYFYCGMPLKEYCGQHPELNYNSISTFIRRLKSKNPTLTDQELVNAYFETEHNGHNAYYYKGERLIDYCNTNGLNYSSITRYLRTIDIDNIDDELIEFAIEKSKTDYTYLYYGGVTLFEYCRTHDLFYSSVYNLIMKLMDEEKLILDDAISKAIQTIKRYGIKYYYDEMPLVEYCKYYNLNYSLVKDKVLFLIKKGYKVSDAIEEAIEIYERKKYFKYLNKIFEYLKKDVLNNNIIYQILIFLNIDFKNYEELMNIYHNSYYVISLIWYYHDNSYGKKLTVSSESLNGINDILDEIKNTDVTNAEQLDLYELLKLYKVGIYDTRYLILAKEENFIFHHMITMSKYYGIDLSEDQKEEILDDVNLMILTLLQKYNNNNPRMFVGYVLKSIKSYLKRLISDIGSKKREISIYQDLKKNIKIIDTIEPISTSYDDDFSDDTKEKLSTLEEIERKFILYKFMNKMDDDEISDILDVEIDELEEIEVRTLSKLKSLYYQ